MKDINESEMNGLIIKFIVSSIIKKNYDAAINDISYLKQNYTQYDLNIYL